jgi:uncharacterized membrane protein
MRPLLTNICLWIAAITLAISVGGNLFQAMVIDPVWSASPPESVKTFAGTPFLAALKTFHTNPLFLVGLICLLASPFLAWNSPGMRKWLLIAAGCYLLVIFATVLYFWPINNALFTGARKAADTATIAAMARRWIYADRIRFAFRLAAFLCVLRAMVLSGTAAIGR